MSPSKILLLSLGLALPTTGLHAQSFQKLTPFPQTLDLVVVDSAFDGVWRMMDLNQDGDVNDAGETFVVYDDTVGSIPLTNPNGIAVGLDGTIYVCDSTEDIVLALRDLDGNGDALGPGEHWVFFDGTNNASGVNMASAQGLTVDVSGAVLVANANVSGGGDDAILLLRDLDFDGDANDANEAQTYALVQAGGSGALGDSIPTKVRVRSSGDLVYSEVGATGVFAKGVYVATDDQIVNGNANDPGEIRPLWIPNTGGNPFFWGFEITEDGTIFLTDHGNERIYRGKDLNGNGTIEPGTAEEVLYLQIAGGSTMWDVAVREDGALIVAEDDAPDRVMLYQDLDSSGTIDQPNESVAIYDVSTTAGDIVKPRGLALLRRPSLEIVPNPVRLGNGISLTFVGRAGSVMGLFASLGPIAAPLPPFGDLELNPTTLFTVTSLALAPPGLAVLSTTIPNDPTLVGTTYLQGFELDPFRPHFTRRVDVAITP